MRRIIVRGRVNEEGYSLGSIFIKQGGSFLDETRNTVFNILRRLPKWIWHWGDSTPMLWDDGTEIPIR